MNAPATAVTVRPDRKRRRALWGGLSLLVAVPVGLFATASLWTKACRGAERPMPPPGPTSALSAVCANDSASADDACMAASLVDQELQRAPVEVLDAHVTAQGHSLPQRLRVRLVRDGQEVVYHVKWKQAPPTGDESNNSPRRELAAFELQKLLYDPERFIVPPTVLRCLPLDHPHLRVQRASAFPGTRCALGMLAYWLPNVRELTEEDVARAPQDPALRRALGDLNVFTYLVEHRDGIGQNFVLGIDRGRPRTFAVDNGMTFGAWRYHPMRLFSSSWCELQVPTLPADVVRKLRALTRGDLERLAVVAELELDGAGVYRNVERSAVFAGQAEAGVRRHERRLQFGLTTSEIDEVHERVGELLAEVDAGEATVMD